MIVTFEIGDNTMRVTVPNLRKKAIEAFHAAVKEGAKDTSRYIKTHLLSGEMLRDTSGDNRAESTTSLPKGQLRKDISVRTTAKGNDVRVAIFVRERSAYVAMILSEGRTGPWEILPKNKKVLHYYYQKGMFAGYEDFSLGTEHPGYDAKPFMRRGLMDRKSAIERLVQHNVRKAMRS